MLTTRIHRLDPSLIPEEQLVEVAKAFAKSDDVVLIDSQGKQTHIPEALFAHFARIVRIMSERRAIVMLPEDEAFTTQAAANYLGMSRQFLARLLDDGAIPFHTVGSHRRLLFKDVQKFATTRAQSRRASLEKLRDKLHAAGVDS